MKSQSRDGPTLSATRVCPYPLVATVNIKSANHGGDGLGDACDNYPAVRMLRKGWFHDGVSEDGVTLPRWRCFSADREFRRCDNCPSMGDPLETDLDGDGVRRVCNCKTIQNQSRDSRDLNGGATRATIARYW
jgi:hypothetical protein